MKISIIGTGYVGLVTGACFAEKGHDVICVDIRAEIVDKINSGIPTIHEPGLEKLLKNNIGRRLRATTNIKQAVQESEISFLCVGTPSDKNGKIDLEYLVSATRDIGTAIIDKAKRHTIIVKSTVVPGTAINTVAKNISEVSGLKFPNDFGIGSNPEFLREGNAVEDSMDPDRILIGTHDEETKKIITAVYESKFSAPIIYTNTQTAEMIKYTNNSFLATLISFSNEIADICETVDGIDATEVLNALTMDGRINPKKPDGSYTNPQIISYMRAGCGYGGSCFPKDVSALIHFSNSKCHKPVLLESVTEINKKRTTTILDRIRKNKGELRGCKIAIFGTAFKPDTDDIRESPALKIIELLLKSGAKVNVTDPEALENTKKVFGEQISYFIEPKDALKDAELVILITKWKNFAAITPEDFKKLMKNPIIFDGRRFYDKKNYSLGIKYYGIGLKD